MQGSRFVSPAGVGGFTANFTVNQVRTSHPRLNAERLLDSQATRLRLAESDIAATDAKQRAHGIPFANVRYGHRVSTRCKPLLRRL
jgi:hypothetical protein